MEEKLNQILSVVTNLQENFTNLQEDFSAFKTEVSERFDGVESEAKSFREEVSERFDRVENEAKSFREETGKRFDRVESEAKSFREEVGTRLKHVAKRIDLLETNLIAIAHDLKDDYKGEFQQVRLEIDRTRTQVLAGRSENFALRVDMQLLEERVKTLEEKIAA